MRSARNRDHTRKNAGSRKTKRHGGISRESDFSGMMQSNHQRLLACPNQEPSRLPIHAAWSTPFPSRKKKRRSLVPDMAQHLMGHAH